MGPVLPTRIRPAFVALALLAGSALAPVGAYALDLPPLRSLQPPLFTADVVVSIDSTARPAVSVNITVPYSELSWVRIPGGYAAGAGLAVVMEPRDRARLYGDSWEKRLLIPTYDGTRSNRNNLVLTRSFPVPPGRYHVRVRVRDLSSEAESEAEDRIELENLASVPVGFADLELGVLDSAATFSALPTRRFGYNADQIAARATMFDRRPGPWPRHANLHYRLLDDASALVVQGDTIVTLEHTAQSVVVRPTSTELFLGGYVFEVERVEGKSRWRTGRSFEVEESGPPRGKEFAQMLEALAYIADPLETDAMRELTPEQQEAAWERFWRRRDPTPDTPRNEYQIEFFRRFRYATQHFTGFGPGWRSDMGRIYIRYGPPDQIEQRPASSVEPQLEIWYYNQPYHRFVFSDREGFGRYTLLNPSSE